MILKHVIEYLNEFDKALVLLSKVIINKSRLSIEEEGETSKKILEDFIETSKKISILENNIKNLKNDIYGTDNTEKLKD